MTVKLLLEVIVQRECAAHALEWNPAEVSHHGQRQGALDLHGPREHRHHPRQVRPPDARHEAEAAGMLDAYLARAANGSPEPTVAQTVAQAA